MSYTPTPRAELPGLPSRRYRAAPKNVTAVRLREREEVPNPSGAGSTFRGEPGDRLLVLPDGAYFNDDASFRERHAPADA